MSASEPVIPHDVNQTLTQPQRQRLEFIDFCLTFFGQLSRGDLLQQFQTGVASATRDLTLYRQLAPNNMELRHHTKLHYRTPEFVPLFQHDAESVLRKLSRGRADGLKLPQRPGDICLDALKLISAPADIVAPLMRAIIQNQAIKATYVSLSSGEKQRELVPHALINSGLRWHVRCFDRATQSFRDFVCTRFLSAELLDGKIESQESSAADTGWQRIHRVSLIPHPKLRHPIAVALDYGMFVTPELSKDQVFGGVKLSKPQGEERLKASLELTLREAIIGYVTRHWRVDCSPDRHLNPLDYPLALEEPELVTQLTDTSLLPGVGSKSQ